MKVEIPASHSTAKLAPSDLRFRAPLHHPDLPFIVLWSQKAACTTVVKWFFYQLDLLTNDMLSGPMIHGYENWTFKKRPSYFNDLHTAILSGKPIIKFVRDPYSRAYSSYLDMYTKSRTRRVHWGTLVRRQIINDIEEPQVSFVQFLRWLAKQEVAKMNMHISPQYAPRDDFFDVSGYKIENLSQAFAALERDFKLPRAISARPELLKSDHSHKKAAMNQEEALAVLRSRMPESKPIYVRFDRDMATGTEFENLVRASFGCDIDRYGYGL